MLSTDCGCVTRTSHVRCEREAVESRSPPSLYMMEATLVAAVVTQQDEALADELRRDALVVDVSSADVMRVPPAHRVYVFCLDASLANVLAERIAEWNKGRAG